MTATFEPVLVLGPDASRDEWLAARRNGIGGSDAAAVLGLDKWRSPYTVYLDKRGEIPPQPDNEAMYWGRRLEPVVAEAFTERTGITLKPSPGTLAHLERRWQLVNVDRITDDGGVLEIKCSTQWLEPEWADGEVPVRALVQVHHALAVTGLTHGYIAGLIGGWDFRWQRVERDEELIESITAREAEFWQRVQDGNPPAPDYRDLDTLSRLYDVDPDKVRVLSPAELVEIERLRMLHREASVLAREAKQTKDTVTAELAAILGDAEIAVHDGETVATYKQQSRAGYTVQPTTYRVARFPGVK